MVVKFIMMQELEKYYIMDGQEQDNGLDLMEILLKEVL